MNPMIFDACALIALADDEKGADVLENYLADENNVCYVHALNFCEVFYHAQRKSTQQKAKELIEEFLQIGLIERNDLDKPFWQEVGTLKAIHRKISLADCCAIALANRLNAVLITSDRHELEILANQKVCRITFFR